MWGSGCVCSGSLSAIRSSACGPDCLLIPSSKVWSWTNKRAYPPPQPMLSTSSSLGSTSSFLYFSRAPEVSLSDPTMREARETFLLGGILTNKYFPHNISPTPYFTPSAGALGRAWPSPAVSVFTSRSVFIWGLALTPKTYFLKLFPPSHIAQRDLQVILNTSSTSSTEEQPPFGVPSSGFPTETQGGPPQLPSGDSYFL